MAALILLVDVDRTARMRTEALLSEAGYLVASVFSYAEAKALLDSVYPDLLIAAVRLEAFNGLHLSARSRTDYPKLPVIITHATADPVLEAEAARQGARFVVNPLENPEFLRIVEEALEEHRHAQPTIRRWPRKQVPGVVEARTVSTHARVHDMSYGGLRLAFDDKMDLPEEFDVTLPIAGLTVKAHRVWTSRSEANDEFWCGVEVAYVSTPDAGDWRSFVDSL